MLDFTDRRVVVTGGSRGLGEAVARTFAEQGARVGVLARDLERAQAAARSIGDRARAWQVDVSSESSVRETFAAVHAEWGGVDVLVNNAGVTRDNLLMRLSAEDWDQVLGVNLKGTFLCSKAVLRTMLKQRAGRIINITSVVGLTGNAGQSNYSASKAGVVGFTRSLAREVATRAITVNAIAPGMFDTDMTRALNEDTRKRILGGIPMGRFGDPQEIAHACLFLASDSAAYITGEVLRVDGGMAMG